MITVKELRIAPGKIVKFVDPYTNAVAQTFNEGEVVIEKDWGIPPGYLIGNHAAGFVEVDVPVIPTVSIEDIQPIIVQDPAGENAPVAG
jgi:hypothetical protein